jgi:hypothetical protein
MRQVHTRRAADYVIQHSDGMLLQGWRCQGAEAVMDRMKRARLGTGQQLSISQAILVEVGDAGRSGGNDEMC